MTKISFIYFDVGGVMIQDFSDSPKWEQMMNVMGIASERHNEFTEYYDTIDTEICLGRHVDTYIPEISSKFDLTLPPDFSMEKYFIDHFDRNIEIWKVVESISSKGLRIGLLTDQYPGMMDEAMAKKLFPPVIWDSIIDSTKVGCRKPMPEIYDIAEQKAGVAASEILFIDNREKNLVPARARGWQTYLYDSKDYNTSNQKLADFLASKMLN